ncbi:MAG: nucleic acid-binding protein [Spirochaetales bacterium]|nr:nucleic acid-binding protein [Spirochaetales bacterium]
MEQTFEKLRHLQEVLSKRIEIEKEIEEIPKALTVKEELLNRLQKSFIEKNDNKLAAEEELSRLTKLMNDAERSRETSEKRMDEISTQREYEALEREIKMATESEQEYRREIQKVSKTIEVLSEMLTSEEELLNQQKEEINEEKAKIIEMVNEKDTLKNEMISEEKIISQDMNSEILFKFERIIKNKSGLGIVPVVLGVCSGCHMTLPAQFANEVRMGDQILFCPYCSRILFHQETENDNYVADEFDEEVSLSDLIDDDFLLD